MTTKKTKLDNLDTSTGKEGAPQETKGAEDSMKKSVATEETKLDSLSYADGKREDTIRKAKELEELVGLNQVNPFGTTLVEVFDGNLKEMTLVDMQGLAVAVGVFPSGTKTSLKNKLQKAFRDYQRGSASFIMPPTGPICEGADRESAEFKRARQLMQEGL